MARSRNSVWPRWPDLDRLLHEKLLPALPIYNQLVAAPFDPAADTVRLVLAPGAGASD